MSILMRILDSTFAASIILFYGVENMNITTIRYQIQRKTDRPKPKVILNPTSNGVGRRKAYLQWWQIRPDEHVSLSSIFERNKRRQLAKMQSDTSDPVGSRLNTYRSNNQFVANFASYIDIDSIEFNFRVAFFLG